MNMIIRKGSNLRQMRNTQHLADTGNSSNFFRHLLRRNTADTGINLIEYHRRNIAAVHQYSFYRQSNTAQLAAAGYLFQVIQRFTHICTENKFQLITAKRHKLVQLTALYLQHTVRHRQITDMLRNALRQRLGTGFTQLRQHCGRTSQTHNSFRYRLLRLL